MPYTYHNGRERFAQPMGIKNIEFSQEGSQIGKKVAKDIGLNSLTTSQLITRLMSKIYIERTVSKGRIRHYSYKERFAITQDGLAILEEFARRDSPWNQLGELLRQESDEYPLKMTIGAVRIVYRLTKFVLKS